MSLQYYLVPNQITADPNDHMAITLPGKAYSIEDVYDEMTHEGSTVTKAEALACFEEIVRGVIRLVKNGNSVNTPLVNISPRISGVFATADAPFNRSAHNVRIKLTAGTRLRGVEGDIPVERTSSRTLLPVPVHYLDHTNDATDETAVPGGAAKLSGSYLKIDEAAADEGVFFVDANGAEFKVSGKLIKNKPAELIFINPQLAAGSYKLEVRNRINGTDTLRVGALADTLTV